MDQIIPVIKFRKIQREGVKRIIASFRIPEHRLKHSLLFVLQPDLYLVKVPQPQLHLTVSDIYICDLGIQMFKDAIKDRTISSQRFF